MPPMFTFHFNRGSQKDYAADIEDQDSRDVLLGTDEIIGRCRSTLLLVQSYSGCLTLIQKAIQDPQDAEMKQQLMAALAHNIDTIRIVYDLSLEVESMFAEVLQLSSRKEARKLMVPTMEKLANLLEFTICFDKIKSTKPEIQNDLSHFRRLVAVNTASNQLERYTDAPLNALSFFVADHCPMLKVLVRATERCRMKDRSAIPVIAELANSYCASVSNLKTKDTRAVLHHLRVMTGAILLYDHTSRDGAFCSKSDVKIKRCLKELVRWKQRQVLVGTGPGQLLDAVKYWSLHLKDVSTPEKLHALLDK